MGDMSTKHASLDRKLFHWVRENQHKLTAQNAIYVLRIYDKGERRHITRRFSQMRARGLLRLVSTDPVETFDVCAVIPYDTNCPTWKQAPQGRLRQHEIQKDLLNAVSIPATTSEEFLARGGQLIELPSSNTLPYRVNQPTGYGFTFDD